jgi:hypothetical protein
MNNGDLLRVEYEGDNKIKFSGSEETYNLFPLKMQDGLASRFFVFYKRKESKPGCWKICNVYVCRVLGWVIDENGDRFRRVKIACQFIRDYPSLSNLWYFTNKNGIDYMICSDHYMAISVYNLNTGELVKQNYLKWCPLNIHVPPKDCSDFYGSEYKDILGQFGIVLGCEWGGGYDFLHFIDFSDIETGDIKLTFLGEIPFCVDFENSFGFISGFRVEIAAPSFKDIDKELDAIKNKVKNEN